MDWIPFIISSLWGIISLIMFMGIAPYCKDLNKADKFLVCFVFIIGGPFFAVSNILETLLNTILPEGWDDEDDFKGY